MYYRIQNLFKKKTHDVNVINEGGYISPNASIIGKGELIIEQGAEIRDFAVLEFGEGVLKLSQNAVVGYGVVMQLTGSIEVGAGTLIGPNSVLVASNHGTKLALPICSQELTRGEIKIGKDVWIGANVTVNYNLEIFSGAIIGANSFVNKNIPTCEVWAGTPARKLKNR